MYPIAINIYFECIYCIYFEFIEILNVFYYIAMKLQFCIWYLISLKKCV